MKFNIERTDTTSDGHISSLTDLYATAPGTFTFRQGPLRQADFGGRITGRPSEFIVDWTFHTQEDYTETSVGSWGGGTGWTGQPLYVEWPDSILGAMKKSGAVNRDFSGKRLWSALFSEASISSITLPVKPPVRQSPSATR